MTETHLQRLRGFQADPFNCLGALWRPVLVRYVQEGWLGLHVDFGPHARGCATTHHGKHSLRAQLGNTCLCTACRNGLGRRQRRGEEGLLTHQRNAIRAPGQDRKCKKKINKKGQANGEETSSKLVPALASKQRFFALHPGGGKKQQKQPCSRPILCVCVSQSVELCKFRRHTGNWLLPLPVLPPSSALCSLTCADWLGESEGWGFVS